MTTKAKKPTEKPALPAVDIEKGPAEVLRVEASNWKGYELVQLRVWYYDGDVLKPTKKGLAVKRSLIPKMIEALQEIDRADAEGGE